MVDLIADNFGLLELLLFVELIVLATAAVFFKAAKIASKNSRQDPLVRFYYVFWQAYSAPVMPVRLYDSRLAEERARAGGVVGVGELTADELARDDAPDLAAITSDDLNARGVEAPLPPPPPAVTGRSSKSSNEPAAAVQDSTLDVRIVGRADGDTVLGRQGRTLVIAVRNDVEDGLANGVVTQLVAQTLGLPVYRVVLLRGQYRADKAFKIVGVEAEALHRAMNALRTADT